MLANTPPMLEAHYGVPMLGAVLAAINTRLDAALIAFQLDHSESKVVIVDTRVLRGDGGGAETDARRSRSSSISTIRSFRPMRPATKGEPIGALDYEALLAEGDPDFAWRMPDDEWDAISLNYTSGTTGNPKGVVYHHRGAALMCYANALAGGMGRHPVYLWTLPMFHCNGWCFPWSLSAVAGTHVCLRWVRAKAIYEAIAEHGVTHLCGAPVVMAALINAPEAEKRAFDAEGRVHHRRGAAAGIGSAGDGGGRVRSHPCLRADGDLRAGRRQRVEERMGRARWRRHRRQGRRGRACAIRRLRSSRFSTRRRCVRCRPTARRSARSSSAAIS